MMSETVHFPSVCTKLENKMLPPNPKSDFEHWEGQTKEGMLQCSDFHVMVELMFWLPCSRNILKKTSKDPGSKNNRLTLTSRYYAWIKYSQKSNQAQAAITARILWCPSASSISPGSQCCFSTWLCGTHKSAVNLPPSSSSLLRPSSSSDQKLPSSIIKFFASYLVFCLSWDLENF